mmetsp:Transcript_81595/g.234461  ORF Transcript_81595/g.234461 Transcript_81595/m.234461 type:complete len:215 (-) Transcript_81595:1036-1680(-)
MAIVNTPETAQSSLETQVTGVPDRRCTNSMNLSLSTLEGFITARTPGRSNKHWIICFCPLPRSAMPNSCMGTPLPPPAMSAGQRSRSSSSSAPATCHSDADTQELNTEPNGMPSGVGCTERKSSYTLSANCHFRLLFKAAIAAEYVMTLLSAPSSSMSSRRLGTCVHCLPFSQALIAMLNTIVFLSTCAAAISPKMLSACCHSLAFEHALMTVL